MGKDIISYSTVKGLLHKKENACNQDSYIVKRYRFGTILVVSDGMGSHRHSDVGSKAVCKAVCKAITIWNDKQCSDIRLLIPLIHAIWGIEIQPFSRNECGATCLFAFIDLKGKMHIGQLGDGDIHIYIDDFYEIFKSKADDFSNLTVGINSIKSFEDWNIKTYNIEDQEIKICMMTDGISETLIQEKKKAFVDLLLKRVAECTNYVDRNNQVFQVINNWGKVNCGDDRTLICYEKR